MPTPVITFRVLGPLEVRLGPLPLDVGAPKLQAVLVALVLNANQAIAAERLAHLVWEEPPAAAAANLRTYLTRLRTLLHVPGECESRVRHIRGSSYQLVVQPGELDIDGFDSLVDAGGRALLRGDHPSCASGHFERALEMWRGPVLDEVPCGHELRLKVAWLEERRLAAVQQWAQIQLQIGSYDAAATVLRDVLAAVPLVERLRAQLMLALDRSGHPQEALESYARLRELLAERLGADPGRELRELRARIAHSPLDAGQPLTAETGRCEALHQLPAGPRTFHGRTAQLDEVGQLLKPAAEGHGPAVVAVDGVAGVGKSAFAVRAAHQSSGRFPDGQLYVDLCSTTPGVEPLTPVAVLGRFLRALGIGPDAVPDREAEASALFRQHVAERRMLFVLDNAASEAQVRPLLPTGSGCAALITTRCVPSGLTEARRLPLHELATTEALAVLGDLIGSERVESEAGPATRIAQQCAGLPLALSIAGARLAARPEWPVVALTRRMERRRYRLDELRVVGSSMRESLGSLYRELTEDSRLAHRRVSLLHAGEVAPWMLAALLDAPLAYARRLLDDLAAVHLVERVTDQGPDEVAGARYRQNELVRLFGLERSRAEDPAVDCLAAMRRVVRADPQFAVEPAL